MSPIKLNLPKEPLLLISFYRDYKQECCGLVEELFVMCADQRLMFDNAMAISELNMSKLSLYMNHQVMRIGTGADTDSIREYQKHRDIVTRNTVKRYILNLVNMIQQTRNYIFTRYGYDIMLANVDPREAGIRPINDNALLNTIIADAFLVNANMTKAISDFEELHTAVCTKAFLAMKRKNA